MSISTILQKSIIIDVDFYNEKEKEKLLTYPTASIMQEMVASPIEISTAEFLTYYLFHRKKVGTQGYLNYQTISRKLHVALSSLDGCITFNGQSISTPIDAIEQLTDVSEHVGEAIGLSIASRIHGLTEADWSPIKSMKGRGALPSFDFQIASDGNTFVQVENKGSSVVDNNLHSPTIKAQYKKIQEKKNKLTHLPTDKVDPNPASLRYGTIAVLDPNQNGNARCWLTDPPPEKVIENPRNFRILQRITFISDWVSFISPRSQLSSALSTRLADLNHLTNPFELNGLPLYKRNNEPFEYDFISDRSFSFLTNKSRVVDAEAGGLVLQITDNQLMLLGIDEKLINIITKQDFEEIENYKFDSFTKNEQVNCIFSQGRFERLRLPQSMKNNNKTNGYHSFILDGVINYSPAGLVFGLLELPEE